MQRSQYSANTWNEDECQIVWLIFKNSIRYNSTPFIIGVYLHFKKNPINLNQKCKKVNIGRSQYANKNTKTNYNITK
ncbi:hypothetical protein BGC33_04350 [Bathymodiolus thermophilus thioautotrophic gill symbiont]|jgi:hypothetical protein|uniref:Uncharacterized protein n=1 Tax=Bathymodiolus thermophilus thioautotrophic gill symbiont TaxID=2360 RepID=A0A1J5TWX4_9GAMM|nr:hypothetical protein BGC33_04350 [Bathymodiolus thermophilus thioautotrophic gill symbiont]